jgi:hypothetical protein
VEKSGIWSIRRIVVRLHFRGNVTLPGELIVSAALYYPEADVIACPGVDGYNDHIMGKEKTPPITVLLR